MPSGCTRPLATCRQQNLKPNSPSRRLSSNRLAGPARGVHSTADRKSYYCDGPWGCQWGKRLTAVGTLSYRW